MAFKNQTFPELRLMQGMQRSREDNTVIFGNGNKEYRIRRHSQDPYTWAWPARNLLQADARTLQAFYEDMQGSLYSFKYEDPDDNTWEDLELEWLDTTRWKVVSNTNSPIYHSSDLTAKLNGSPVGALSITVVDEIPIITVPGSNSGSTVTISGTFHYAARFASPISFETVVFDSDGETVLVGLDSFALKEVKEYA